MNQAFSDFMDPLIESIELLEAWDRKLMTGTPRTVVHDSLSALRRIANEVLKPGGGGGNVDIQVNAAIVREGYNHAAELLSKGVDYLAAKQRSKLARDACNIPDPSVTIDRSMGRRMPTFYEPSVGDFEALNDKIIQLLVKSREAIGA